MGKIICGPDNVKEFNHRLRELSPEFHELAKQLHQAGLLQGLGGATIQTGIDEVETEDDYRPSDKTCGQCGHWERDAVGDGSGVGCCVINAVSWRLKWPGQISCNSFKKIDYD